jgi:Holliday junction resolvase RusA-like endonuclease
MTFSLSFTVPGQPVAKGRPRLSTIGGKARAFTPAKTVRYEHLVAKAAQQAMQGRPPVPAGVAVTADIIAWLPVPASWSRKKRDAAILGDMRPTSRPDVDNFAKAALDGMNGIVFHDDAQIVRLEVSKRYGPTPCLAIVVMEYRP